MDFEISDRAKDLKERLTAFVNEKVLPAEPVWAEQVAQSVRRGARTAIRR